MKLIDAVKHTRSRRPKWVNGAGAETARINSEHIIRILGPDFDCSTVKSVDYTHLIEELQSETTSRGPRSNSGINRILGTFDTILREMIYLDIIERVPTHRRLPETNKLVFYSSEQIDQLEDTANVLQLPEVASAIRFAFLTGCRRGELMKLTCGDIDLGQNKLVFRKTKNGKDHVLTITPKLLRLLEPRVTGKRSTDLVFNLKEARSFYQDFTRVRLLCGIPDGHTFHTIRHSTGTHLCANGASLRAVMGVLNHSDLKMTLRYAKATDKSIAEALALL
jgi:integrase